MKKCLSWLLVLVMVLAMAPMTAFAEQTDVEYVAGEYQGITIPAGSYINVTVDATASAMTLVVDNGFGYWDWYVQAGMMSYYPSMRGSAEIELEAGMVYTLPIYNMNAEEDIVVGVSAAATASNVGTWDSPAALIMGDNPAEIEAGAFDGYYWSWTATGNGDLYVEVSAMDGWMYNVNNLTSGVYGETHWSDDDEVIASETIAVSVGDQIQIMASTYDPASYTGAPAGSVNIFAWFEPAAVEAPTTGPETVTYVNAAIPTGYVAAEGDTTTWVDITEAHTAVLGSDGYYHLDSENGDIIIVKMTADNPYGVNLPGVVAEGRMKIPVRNESGSIASYYDTVAATKAYIDAANDDGWVYLTSDLIYIFQGYGAAQGWYMSGISFYLGDVDFDPDTAWMLSCATVSSAASGEEVKGDLNGDGILDDADVAHLLWYTLFPDQYVLAGEADFNGDKVINDADVAYLLWHTLFPENYPI